VLRNGWLVAASYAFYAWWDWRFAGLMLASSLVDYAAGLRIARTRRRSVRRTWLAASLTVNLGILGLFKYFEFFAASFADAVTALGGTAGAVTLDWVLPIGVSFYTFQTLSYTIDVYRRRVRPSHRILDYLAFVSFFPQLVAGPIERAGRLLPQFAADRRFESGEAAEGCRLMLWGFVQKMVVADNLALLVDPIYASPADAGAASLALATGAFGLQIYFDFAGYSSIAIGTARLFGIRLMRNFANPYHARSIAEFWRRWHISLSTWFRDYVYIPLGGRADAASRHVRNLVLTFAASGLWHGAAWTYVVWGVWHGVAAVPGSLRRRRTAARPPAGEPGLRDIRAIAGTLLIVMLAWVPFRANSLGDVVVVYEQLLIGWFDELAWVGWDHLPNKGWTLAAAGAVLLVEWVTRPHPHPFAALHAPAGRWAAYSVCCWSVVLLGTRTAQSFVYFQF
jgi:D-alanyl-lipoteichoic acid acyltransferase DltB (MBOAT superfamily)